MSDNRNFEVGQTVFIDTSTPRIGYLPRSGKVREIFTEAGPTMLALSVPHRRLRCDEFLIVPAANYAIRPPR
jgi:hypothetical protein